MENKRSGYIVNLKDLSTLKEVTESFNNSLSYPYMVMTWKEKNSALFKWMNIQRWPILFIFGLIGLVGLVNIISSFAMIIVDKSRQIGILKSLGLKNSQLKLTFLMQGLMVGLIGSLIGSSISLVVAWLQNSYKIIQVPEDIYFMNFIPIDINFFHIFLIASLAIMDRIIGFESDLRLTKINDWDSAIDLISNFDEVKETMPFQERKGLILGRGNAKRMVSLKAVNMDKISSFYDFNSFTKVESADLPIVYLGEMTARRLNVDKGDIVRIFSPIDYGYSWGLPVQIQCIVGGVFNIQVLDLDDKIAFIPRY